MSAMRRQVSAHLVADVAEPTHAELQLTVADEAGREVAEDLEVSLDGHTLPLREVAGPQGTRLHLFTTGPGRLVVDYHAAVDGVADPAPVTDLDAVTYSRPSRYAESDRVAGFASGQFRMDRPESELLTDVASWVGTHLVYLPGSSGPADGAADSLLAGAGVCRDFAHLSVALLRAMNVPARLVAVYAPGCDPMDFHAVTEALVDGSWRVVDATCLAPRQTLVRIATGRDAADTAFLTNTGGRLTLRESTVTATVEGDLPVDDLDEPVSLG